MLKLLSPPKFEDADLNRRVVILYRIVYGFLLVITLNQLVATIIQPHLWLRYLVIFLVLLTGSAVTIFFTKKGYFRRSAFFYVIFVLALNFGSAWTGGGIRSHAIKMLPVMVLFAGLTLGRSYVWIFGGLGFLGCLTLVLAEKFNLLAITAPLGNSPWTYMTVLCITILALCYLEYISVEGLNKALHQARKELELRKKSEEEIILLNESLETRIRERTKELTEKNMELDAYNHSVSHDLQQPLAAINFMLNTIQERDEKALNDKAKRDLRIITECTQGMQVLVRELLNMSKLSKQELSKKPVDMKTFVEGICDEIILGGHNPKPCFIIGEMSKAMCDPLLVKQIWMNLISNSIKYSKKDVVNNIEIGSEVIDDEVVFFIKDNGVGFSMDKADKLFTTFARLHKSSEFEGTGVGLSTVYRIVGRHGGRIWAISEENKGASFYFTLESANEKNGQVHSKTLAAK